MCGIEYLFCDKALFSTLHYVSLKYVVIDLKIIYNFLKCYTKTT